MAYSPAATTSDGRNGRAVLENGGLALAKVSLPGADKAKMQALVEDAHRICPYSKATRGNVPVTLTVV